MFCCLVHFDPWYLSLTLLVPGQFSSSRSLLLRCSLHSELISTGYIFKFKQFYIYWQVKEIKRWRGKQNCGSILASLALHLFSASSAWTHLPVNPLSLFLSSSSHASANFQLLLLGSSPLQFWTWNKTGGSFLVDK